MRLLSEAKQIAASEPTMRGFVERNANDWPDPEATRAAKAIQFDEARERFRRVVKSDEWNHWNWYQLACVELYLGDDGGYRKAAMGMFDRFGQSNTKTIGERTAKICLLTSQPVGDMQKLTALLDQAMATPATDDLYPWFSLSKSLGEYRAGRFDSALQMLEKADAVKPAAAKATVELIKAMTCQQLKRAGDAKELLASAIGRIDRELTKSDAVTVAGPENWLICQILRREAEQLIMGKTATTQKASTQAARGE
jgi:tetratricopeptide (TPR) repeat protein